MKNLLASWFRNLTALDESPVEQSFSIVDPTAAPANGGLNTVVLSVAPSDGNSPTMVSLRFDPSGVKLFEKKYQNDGDAQAEMSAMATDLNEAASLSKEGKVEEAKKLAESLFEKYKRHSDPVVNEQPTPTMTQAALETLSYKGWAIHKRPEGDWMGEHDVMSLRADSLDTLKTKIDNMLRKAYGKKLVKSAEIVMQNLFFSTPDEALQYQEKMKKLQGPETGSGKPLWEQTGGEEIAPSNESTEPEEDTELAPPSLSFDRLEKDKARSDKDIGKRIKEQVKTEVESALEQKSASVFGPDQEDLVEALRKNGRNWDEIKKIFVKELSYNEDDTTVFLDSIRQKEEGGPEGLPLPPKPPEDLVSPETHDKLIKEIDDKSEPKLDLKPEPKPLENEIARADNAEIRKVATNSTLGLDGGDKIHISDRGERGHQVTWESKNGQLIDIAMGIDELKAKEIADAASQALYETSFLREPQKLEDARKQIKYVQQKLNVFASKKVALNPLQEPPAVGQTPGQPLAAPVEEAPTFDSPVPPSQDSNPEPEFLEAPKAGDRVYVMGDYETGEDGYEGTMVSDYTSKGDEYAVVAKDNGENAEPALHRVVKASQKKVAKAYYEKKASVTDSSRGRNWKVTYYDKNDKVISSHTIKDRTEAEAEKEATGDMPSGCEDWSMMPVTEKKADAYQPKTGELCSCRPGNQRDNCPSCEGTGMKIDFKKIREKNAAAKCEVCEDIRSEEDPSREYDPTCVGHLCVKHEEEWYKNKEKKADLEVESKGNEDVIRMFIGNSFPKDKMPVWGTANLKITKYPNGWALVNYQTPILYRANDSDVVVFNTKKYSVTTSKIQSQIRRNFAGQSVQETDERGMLQAIQLSNEQAEDKTQPEPEVNPELQSLHESALKLQAELLKLADDGDGSLLAIYNLDRMVTSYNEVSQDWSGETQDFGFIDKGEIHVNSMEEALAKVKEIYSMDFEPVPDEPGRFETNQTENADGYTDPNGKYLADYSVYIKLYKEHTASKKAELEREGEIAIYFHKEGIEKQASGDSAFEANGWCRVWVDDLEIQSDAKYPEILKLQDETARIDALKVLARDIAHEALNYAESASGKFGVQTWFESLKPSRHDRIDWVSLASPEPENVESSQEPKIEKKAEDDDCPKCHKFHIPAGSSCEVEKQAADLVPPAEGPKEVPTQFKNLERAPAKTDREKAQPATEEQAKLVQDMQSSLSSLEAIKSMVTQAKAKLNEEIKNIEQKGGRVQLEAGLKEKMDRLAKLVEATENQMINAGDTVVRLVQETKEKPFKPSDTWKVQKLVEKFAGAQEYLDKAIAGAQSLATTEQVRDLVFFPRKVSKLHKSAGFIETLDSVYNNVLEALKLIITGNGKEERNLGEPNIG